METHRRGAAGSRTTTPSRPTRRSAIDHPTSTGAPSSWETLSASPNCLTNRGTEHCCESWLLSIRSTFPVSVLRWVFAWTHLPLVIPPHTWHLTNGFHHILNRLMGHLPMVHPCLPEAVFVVVEGPIFLQGLADDEDSLA